MPQSWFNHQYLKEKKTDKREKDLNWMGNFKIESRYLKLSNVFRAVIRCILWCILWYFLQTRLSKSLNASVVKKTRPCICFKTCDRVLETLSQAFKTLGRAFEDSAESYLFIYFIIYSLFKVDKKHTIKYFLQ